MVERSTKCKVLVVEDDPVSCQAMRALLARWGYDVESCSTTAEALAQLDHSRRCVILDLMLPDSNGIEVLRSIRSRNAPIFVAVVSAAYDPTLMREVRALKPDLLLPKPVDVALLKKWLGAASEQLG